MARIAWDASRGKTASGNGQIDLPIEMPAWAHGVSRDQVTAMAAFRLAFESLHRQMGEEQLTKAFEVPVVGGPEIPTQ